MISLLFKFFGDSKPLVAEGDKAKAALSKKGGEVGKAFGEQFKGAVMGFVGAGAIIGAVRKMAQDAVRIRAEAAIEGVGVEEFQKLEIAAKSVGMSVSELREAAPGLASEFAALMDAVESSSGIMDAGTVKNLADAAAELGKFTGPISQLVAGLVHVLSFVRAVGEKALTAAAGGAMTLAGKVISRFTGDRSLEQAGKDLSRDAFATPVDDLMGKAMEDSAARDFVAANKARIAAAKSAQQRITRDAQDAQSVVRTGEAKGMFQSQSDAKEFLNKLEDIKRAIEDNG